MLYAGGVHGTPHGWSASLRPLSTPAALRYADVSSTHGLNAYGSLPWKGSLDTPAAVEEGLSYQAQNATRYRLNGVSLLQSLLGPWLLFSVTLWLMSSWIRYYHGHECWFVVGCIFFGLLCLVAKASRQAYVDAQRAKAGASAPQASWLAFLALSCAVAFLAAVTLGEYNYEANVAPFYNYKDLSVVYNVDPRIASGSQFMDSGIILFKNGSFVDVSKSLAYKQGNEYCVAPITFGSTPLASYEFWAVGKDCCNPYGGQFWCGGVVGSTVAKAGVVSMKTEELTQYRLAVQQAQAQYRDFTANHPLFVTWAEDPTDDTNALRKDNPEHYAVQSQSILRAAITTYFLLQGLAVLAVVSFYARPLDWLL